MVGEGSVIGPDSKNRWWHHCLVYDIGTGIPVPSFRRANRGSGHRSLAAGWVKERFRSFWIHSALHRPMLFTSAPLAFTDALGNTVFFASGEADTFQRFSDNPVGGDIRISGQSCWHSYGLVRQRLRSRGLEQTLFGVKPRRRTPGGELEECVSTIPG